MSVDWHSFALWLAASLTLVALTAVVRGPQAAARMCCVIGILVAGFGLVTGRLYVIAAGAVIIVVVYRAGGA